jgi:hypothetical protein
LIRSWGMNASSECCFAWSGLERWLWTQSLPRSLAHLLTLITLSLITLTNLFNSPISHPFCFYLHLDMPHSATFIIYDNSVSPHSTFT